MNVQATPDQFRHWRMRRGISQQKAAEILGYKNRSIVCHFEAGRKPINARVWKLCLLLDEKDARDVNTNTDLA